MSDIAQRFQAALAHQLAGRLAEAEQGYRDLLRSHPRHVDSLQLLGLVFAARGDLVEAADLTVRAIEIGGDNPAILNNLGEIRRQQNELAAAEVALRRAIELAPNFVEAHYNLGLVKKSQERLDDAVGCYRTALQLDPRHQKARFNLANLLREMGKVPVAVREYQTLVQQCPDWYDARLNHGAALAEMGQSAEALAEYECAWKIRSGDADLAMNVADVYIRQGRPEQARAWGERARKGTPDDWLSELKFLALAHPFPADRSEIEEYRAQVADRLSQLEGETLTLGVESLHRLGAEPPMLLAYQGLDDRPLKEAYARLFERLIPAKNPAANREGMPRIGFVVTRGHEGVFARCMGGLIARLDRTKIDARVVCSLAGRNVLESVFLQNSPVRYFVLPEGIVPSCEALEGERFDLLIYWEVGTDATNYFLPLFQPALKQWGTWGWPVTSGSTRFDRYMTFGDAEPPDGLSHYTENLLRIEGSPTYYERPPAFLKRSREPFGLSDSRNLYLCPQNLRKYHPDFDGVLASILREDADGELLLIVDDQPTLTQLLATRLSKSMGDLMKRVRWVPRLERVDYLSLLSVVDVNLDTLHYGGGANTVYDSVAIGTPMVTWEGPFHRGRFASATLRRMGLEELVVASPEEYVTRAVEIGRDRSHRHELSGKISSSAELVLEYVPAVRQIEEAILEACGNGTTHRRKHDVYVDG